MTRHTESRLQAACVAWFRMKYRNLSPMLFAVPNGGYRSAAEARMMKAEGVTAGVSDLILLLSRGGYTALCIEMKTTSRGSQLSPTQKLWQQAAAENGCKCAVCRDIYQFKETVENYLNGEIEK